jgi:UDP-glucose 4-epimerase
VCARHNVRTMLASTSEVYGKASKLPFSEDDDIVLGSSAKSRWSYAASKLVDEFVALAHHEETGLPVTIFRLFNTVGPRQSGRYGMVIPRFVSAALRGERLQIHDDGEQTRCFLHVTDAISAILGLTDSAGAIGRVFNVGSDESTSIIGLARRALALAGVDDAEIPDRLLHVPYDQVYGPGFEDMRARRPDTTRLRQTTGWRPTRSLDDILADVFAYERAAANVPTG